jgi:inner membrane protein
MIFRTHLLSYFVLDISMPFVYFVFLIAATVFVDIDTKNSKLGKNIVFRPLQVLFKHRGGIHSIFSAVLISVIIASVIPWAGVGFFVGYFGHIFLDFLTRGGVPLLWPISSQKFGLMLKTKGVVEDVIFVALIFFNFILLEELFIGWIF